MWLAPDEEDAWWAAEEERQRIYDEFTPVVRKYAEEYAPASFATVYLEGDLLYVGFSEAIEEHRNELRRRIAEPSRLRVFRAAHSESERDAVQERIHEVDDALLAAAGIEVVGSHEDDPKRNGLVVEIVATDPHSAQRVFADRYGDIVRIDVLGTSSTTLEPVEWGQYSLDEDGRTMTVYWTTNATYDFERLEVDEGEDDVRVTVLERVPVGATKLPLARRSESVTLQATLGDRVVRDAATGRTKSKYEGTT